MPTCYITFSDRFIEGCDDISILMNPLRDIIADGLDSKSRLLDRNHISIRYQVSFRQSMLADVELDIFAQFFWRRYITRDKRANLISQKVSTLLNADCATWINLNQVGYSRHTKNGVDFYSIKADDIETLKRRKQHNRTE